MEWPFQERDVAQQSKQLGGARTGVGSIRTAGQKDERQIRPCRLLAKTAGERLYLAWKHRLIGRDDKQGLVVNESLERLEVRANLGGNAGLPQKPESNRGIASVRSQYQAPACRSN